MRNTVYDCRPGEDVLVRVWGHGSDKYQRTTHTHPRWRWKVATILWIGGVGNTSGCYVRFSRPNNAREVKDFVSYANMKIKPKEKSK